MSALFRSVVRHVAGGQHVIIHGYVDDLFFYNGDVVPLSEGISRIADRYDVHVHWNASTDGIAVLKGGDRWQVPAGRSDDPVVALRRLLANPDTSCLIEFDQANLLFQDPANDPAYVARVAEVQLALREAAVHGAIRSIAIFVTPSLAGLPEEIRSGSEQVAVIEAGRPSREERTEYLLRLVPSMHGMDRDDAPAEAVAAAIARMTPDEPLRMLQSVAWMSTSLRVDANDPRLLLQRWRHGEVPDYWAHVRTDLADIEKGLRERVLGQDAAITVVVAGLAAAGLGLNMTGDPYALEGQPRLVLILVGPTGVGKTQLANILAELVYGDRSAYQRIDCGTLSSEATATRLTGAPPAYVGYEEGGELTEAVRRRPASVILFDEIEKAHPLVFDSLLSVIDEGRVTDAQGNPAFFSEAILLFTSNMGFRRQVDPTAPGQVDLAGYTREELERHYRGAGQDFFLSISRPELWSRFEQGLVVFDSVNPDTVALVTARIISDTSYAHGPRLDIDVDSAISYTQKVMEDPAKASLGYREVRNTIRASLHQLAAWTVLQGHATAGTLSVRFNVDGSMAVSVDDGSAMILPAGDPSNPTQPPRGAMAARGSA